MRRNFLIGIPVVVAAIALGVAAAFGASRLIRQLNHWPRQMAVFEVYGNDEFASQPTAKWTNAETAKRFRCSQWCWAGNARRLGLVRWFWNGPRHDVAGESTK